MKKVYSFLTMWLLAFFAGGTLWAADLPITSPADGSADVWYHIRLEQRTFGLYGGTTTVNDGSVKGYYFDQGIGKMLINIEDTVNAPGSRWKFVATATAGEYQLISGLGNTIDYAETAFGEFVTEKDRYYTAALGSQVFTIKTNSEGYQMLTLKSAGSGIDKGNGHLYFDKYGSGAGTSIAFIAAAPLTGEYLIQPADLDFSAVPPGKTKTKTLNVVGYNLTSTLTYSIAGEGFSVVPGASSATGGTAEVTFAPTEKKAYAATLTITVGEQSVSIALAGNADFEFPLQISDNTNEYWYYIQFARQAENNKVIQAPTSLNFPLTQGLITGNADNQLWKIVGDWDEYHIVSKTGLDGEFDYNSTSNKYVLGDEGYGNEFGFDRFNDTEDWQLRSNSSTYHDPVSGASATEKYLNDCHTSGD
jgi:hypothetical protein